MKLSRVSVFPPLSCAVSGMLLLLPFFTSGGRLNMESVFFLANYNTPGRSVFALVFDPFRNDWNLYQARELSYFIDFLDARLLAGACSAGRGSFHSLAAFALTLATIVFLQIAWTRLFAPALDRRLIGLGGIFFTLTPCVIFNAFFRSAKYGAALGIALAAAGTANFLLEHGRGKAASRAGTLTAAALFGAGLFDRQGAFFAAAWTIGSGAVLAWLLLAGRTGTAKAATETGKNTSVFSAKLLLANLLLLLYGRYLAPLLIFSANGYWPDGGAQRIELNGRTFSKIVSDGMVFNFGNLGTALTGLGGSFALTAGAIAGGALFSGFLLLRRRSGDPRATAALWMFVLFELAYTAAGGVMSLKHPYLLTPWVMTSAYFLPGLVIYAFFAVGLSFGLARSGVTIKLRILLPVVLILLSLKTSSLFRDERIFAAEPGHELILKAVNDPDFDSGELLLTPPEERLVKTLRRRK